MFYYLKKSYPSKKGLYLQIYVNYYDSSTKSKKTKSYKSLGYVSDLINSGIKDPISYYNDVIKSLNDELSKVKDAQISHISTKKYAGHFLIHSLFNYLDMDNTLNIIANSFNCHYTFSDMFRTLCYSQIISPGSKLKAFERVIPNIYQAQDYSYDQILDAINFIGSDYHKYIEMLNHHIELKWKRDTSIAYFDCTNYYFEIDLEKYFLKKGPSKENQQTPLLGQALMLDADQIPIDTIFYPGNQSEKPFLRNRIEDMKSRNNISGRVIQVADKGLNCARNIYSAVIEANDGYIFSKSIRGRNISKELKEWILLEDNSINKWEEIRDDNGQLLYRYKQAKRISSKGEVLDHAIFTYKCKINEDDTKETEFDVKEKRIVTYNPELAKKQKQEILKEVDKAKQAISYKQAIKEDLGDACKYVNFQALDKDGVKVKIATSINEDKVKEDLAYAGYNMIVTSEINADPKNIIKTYHNLWRIEESFRILKTYLESRPAFCSNEYTIYGHFLICYFSLTLVRLLELKIFNDEIPASRLFEFMRQYNITLDKYGSYINNSTWSHTYEQIKDKLGIAKLGNLYLSKKDVDMIFQTELE